MKYLFIGLQIYFYFNLKILKKYFKTRNLNINLLVVGNLIQFYNK